MDLLKFAAYCAYLAAWLVFALAAAAGALPRLRRQNQPALESGMTPPVFLGTLLQVLGAFVLTGSMGSGPLRARPVELAGALLFAPAGAAVFVWALRSAPKNTGADRLVTTGAYQWLRHPIYLAFLAMLLLYIGGSELRIASEEAELAERFPEEFARFRRQTRWRYLPGLR
jgi:protein-S-isoprenylcysteine O-methyltransferase Ste14